MKNHSHTPEAIAERLANPPKMHYLRDWIYGGIDGAITTFAIVAGVIGAKLSVQTIIILGLANVVADGFSMAASNFLGTRAEGEQLKFYQRIEHEHIEKFPEGEVEEIRQIFQKKGFKGYDLERAVTIITSDRNQWIKLMLQEEYGVSEHIRSPLWSALATFSAFMVCGFVPLLPFLFDLPHAFTIAIITTGITFFLIGSIKSRWSIRSWWRTGLYTLAIGGVAAGLAYGIGYLAKLWVG